MEKEIRAFIEGYKRFRAHYFESEKATFPDLVHRGQSPKALMVACSDSRVDPTLMMGCAPGDVFVVRNVANLVPPYEDDQHFYHGTSAALEFGINVLEIPHVILLGHTPCGGIQSLLEHAHEKWGPKSFLNKWMELAKAAYEAVTLYHAPASFEEKTILCSQYSLVNSLKNLQTFPWIADRIQQGTLTLHAWNFDMLTGELEAYDQHENCFKPLTDLRNINMPFIIKGPEGIPSNFKEMPVKAPKISRISPPKNILGWFKNVGARLLRLG